jgi:siderophore synthetase component
VIRDDFEFVLYRQYSDSLEEIIIESESVYRSELDYELFSKKLQGLIDAAKFDGLKEEVLWNIVDRKIPDYRAYVVKKAA